MFENGSLCSIPKDGSDSNSFSVQTMSPLLLMILFGTHAWNAYHSTLTTRFDFGVTSLFLDRYNDERLLKGWGMVGWVHGLHEIFGCSGSVSVSVADGTYDDGKGSAGGLQTWLDTVEV